MARAEISTLEMTMVVFNNPTSQL
jgi:hypothetical protein